MSRLQPLSVTGWRTFWAKMEACRAMLYTITQAYDAGRPDPMAARPICATRRPNAQELLCSCGAAAA